MGHVELQAVFSLFGFMVLQGIINYVMDANIQIV